MRRQLTMNHPVSQRTRRPFLRDEGFTLIELVVAISIIGMLAAIAVPSYLALQTTVRRSATLADLDSDRTALIAYSIDNNGLMPASTGFDPLASGSNLVGYGWSQSSDTTSYRYLANAARTGWCLDMTNSTGTVSRISTNNTAATTGACSALSVTSY